MDNNEETSSSQDCCKVDEYDSKHGKYKEQEPSLSKSNMPSKDNPTPFSLTK